MKERERLGYLEGGYLSRPQSGSKIISSGRQRERRTICLLVTKEALLSKHPGRHEYYTQATLPLGIKSKDVTLRVKYI